MPEVLEQSRVGQIQQTVGSTPFTGQPEYAEPKTPLSVAFPLLLKVGLWWAGRRGQLVVSTASLIVALLLMSEPASWMLYPAALLLVLRTIYAITRKPEALSVTRQVRKGALPVIIDETKISLAFLAACYIAEWPVEKTSALLFVPLNVVAQLGFLHYTRVLLRQVARYSAKGTRKAIIVGTGLQARAVADLILASPDIDTEVLGFVDFRNTGLWRYRDIPSLGVADQLETLITQRQVDAVFLAIEPADMPIAQDLFYVAENMGVTVFVLPDCFHPTTATPDASILCARPVFIYRPTAANQPSLFFKACFDRTVALLLLIATSPVFLLTALCIRLDSPGSIFFKQLRLGLNGRPFYVFKFRSMRSNAEFERDNLKNYNVMSGPMFKMKDDPRITRVGRFIRKYSIDELPQLLNVLMGDMSLVGPRPSLPSEVHQFAPWQRRKLSVKPGLTCIWQVSGRNAVDFENWMRLDLQYIDKWSLWMDAKILLKTIPAVLKGSGL